MNVDAETPAAAPQAVIRASSSEDQGLVWSPNGKWIVLETYNATEATISFATSADVNLKAHVEKAGGVTVSGGGGVSWKGKRSFSITGNNQVPFGFRGWKV